MGCWSWKRLADALIDVAGLAGYSDTPAQALSTGTRRIAELLCLATLKPRLLLLDEPSAASRSVKSSNSHRCCASWLSLDTTIIVIDHDLPMIRRVADRDCGYGSGEILADGPTEAVLADERVIDAYIGRAPSRRPAPAN